MPCGRRRAASVFQQSRRERARLGPARSAAAGRSWGEGDADCRFKPPRRGAISLSPTLATTAFLAATCGSGGRGQDPARRRGDPVRLCLRRHRRDPGGPTPLTARHAHPLPDVLAEERNRSAPRSRMNAVPLPLPRYAPHMGDGRPRRLVDIANYLGVSTQRVHQLTKDPSFPTPSIQAVGDRLWRRSAIEAWARRRWWGTRPWRRRPA